MLLTFGNLRYRQLSGGAHPAVILAYIRQDSVVPKVVKELEAQPTLKQAGHKFYPADDPAKLSAALKTGKYDILLADVADADYLEEEARSALSKPVVLPVVPKSSKDEANAVERRFHCILTAPDSPGRYLAAIDKAMELKLKRR